MTMRTTPPPLRAKDYQDGEFFARRDECKCCLLVTFSGGLAVSARAVVRGLEHLNREPLQLYKDLLDEGNGWRIEVKR